MIEFKAKKMTRRFTQRLLGTPGRVFPLLCPTREYEWIEPWKCELLRSDSGFAEANCVFRTSVLTEGVEDVWVISHYEPSKRIDFVRLDGRRVMSYSIVLETAADGTTTAHNTQVVTALNEEGNRILGDESSSEFFDPEHSESEARFIRVGYSSVHRLLLVVFCERWDGDIIRLISARRASGSERHQHEEGI